MKNTIASVLAAVMAVGFVMTGNAKSADPELIIKSEMLADIDPFGQSIAVITVLKRIDSLLNDSVVGSRLKNSEGAANRHQYKKAMVMYDNAVAAHRIGDDVLARSLAIGSARIIARAMPEYYRQLAPKKESVIFGRQLVL